MKCNHGARFLNDITSCWFCSCFKFLFSFQLPSSKEAEKFTEHELEANQELNKTSVDRGENLFLWESFY